MNVPDQPAAERLVADETTAVLRQRLRIALILCLAPIAAFAVFDLYLIDPKRLAMFYAVKLVAVAIALGAILLLGPARSRGVVISVGLGSVGLMYTLSTISAILAREPVTTPILTVAVALGTATLLPWGVAPQVAVVVIAGVSIVATVYGATGSWTALLQYPTVGVAIGLGLSIYVALEFQRSRRALGQRRAEQRRADAAVRQLNQVLEARVTARTAELQRSEASLSALIENANDAIWSIDRSYRMIALNSVTLRRFRERFGGTLLTGATLAERVEGAMAREWRAYYDRGLAGERFTIEHEVETAAGTGAFVTSFNPIVTDGTVSGLAIFSTDVTDKRRAEAEARQHQAELTHVLRLSTMGEMAAGLAHEINQPLAAIVNYAQGCARRLRANPAAVASVIPVIDDIAGEALRAGEIIRRLRALIRKEAPRQDWVDVDAVAADALRLLEPEARDHGVVMRRECNRPLPPVLADRIQIEQVILNLLRNAIDAMVDQNGPRELTIITRCLDGESVELAVCDTGPGLPAAAAERVFDAFFSTKPSGLGMGLSISRSIVEAHRGRLWATANPEGGSTFHFTLPVDTATAGLTSTAV